MFAYLTELGFDKADMDFSDLSSFEAFAIAENVWQFVNDEEFADSEIYFDVTHYGYESLAVCGLIGDGPEEDIELDRTVDDNVSAITTQFLGV